MTPASHHGRFENPKKSAYAFEKFDADWERQYMVELDADPDVDAWTKRHKIRVSYIDHQSRKRQYRPDFLVRGTAGGIELHEVKGGHLIQNPDTKRKFEAAQSWCAEREMAFIVVTKES
ncbi:MAG: TnsA endonuclease N-terminal domain-containing protein [Solirubrobacteraceae bacterium]